MYGEAMSTISFRVPLSAKETVRMMDEAMGLTYFK
jgi:hypothetical protein